MSHYRVTRESDLWLVEDCLAPKRWWTATDAADTATICGPTLREVSPTGQLGRAIRRAITTHTTREDTTND